MIKLLVLLTVISYSVNEQPGDILKEWSGLVTSLASKVPKLNTTDRVQLDTITPVSIQTSMQIYFEKYCTPQQFPIVTAVLTGNIQDNHITFTEVLTTDVTGLITISPDENLQGFNIEFGLSEFTNGFQLHFSDNNMKCKTNEGVYDIPNMKGEVCVQSYNLKRASGGTVSACFVIGGAVISNNFYTINTINSFNTMSSAVIDFGCYSATKTSISQSPNTDSQTRLSTTLKAMIVPLHAKLCNSASQNAPLFVLLLILTLKLILSN